MSLSSEQKSFISYLLSLGRERRDDFGTLAELRRGLGKLQGKTARMHKHVRPYLLSENYSSQYFYITASAFVVFPKHHQGRSLGSAFRNLRSERYSMEARFLALLSAHVDDLGYHLYHAIKLLKSSDQPLDWFRLFDDLLHWDHPGACVQKSWARDFYRYCPRKIETKSCGGNDDLGA